MIRVPIMHIKGIAQEFVTRYLEEREKGLFEDLADFLERCRPGEAEAIALLDSGALDCFGLPRPFAFWQIRRFLHTGGRGEGASLYGKQMTRRRPPRRVNSDAETRRQTNIDDHNLPPVDLTVPDLRQIARREMELLGFPITIDPLTFLGEEDDGSQIDWSAYVPVNELDRYCGRRVRVCGIMIADRINLTTEGDLMKFVSLADRTGVVETFLFPDTYRRFGHLTVSNPILAARGVVEPFENRNGIGLRVEHVTLPRRVGTDASSE
jgi:DNA polymerase III alpha subunit